MPPSPVLLLHSGGFSPRQWKKLADLLAPTHPVLAPAHLGYPPGAPWPVGEPFDFHQDVDAVAARLTEPVHAVGHSYGGLIALHLALAYPAKVRSLALFEPVAFGILDEPADADARAELEAVAHAYTPDAAGVDDHWLAGFVDWWNGPGAWAALPEPTKASMRAVGWKLSEEVRSLAADHTDRAGYRAITVPALILGGDRSPLAARRAVEKLARTLPAARLQVFPGLGHMAPITHAAEINAAIAGFLAELP